MLFVVDDEEEHAEKEGGQDVTEDDLPLEIVEVRDKDVDEGGETEEDNTEAAADGVHQPEGSAVFLQTSLAFSRVILDMFFVAVVMMMVVMLVILVTLHHQLNHVPVAGDPIIDTKVVFKSRLRVVERPVGDQKMSAGPLLHDQSLTLLAALKEVVAQTEVGEAAGV